MARLPEFVNCVIIKLDTVGISVVLLSVIPPNKRASGMKAAKGHWLPLRFPNTVLRLRASMQEILGEWWELEACCTTVCSPHV